MISVSEETSNLFKTLKRVNKTVDKGQPMAVFYLDFQKAFDKVPEKRLQRKLSNHRVRGKVLCGWRENKSPQLRKQKQRGGTSGPSQHRKRLQVECPGD